MHFRKLFFIALVALAGGGIAGLKAREIGHGLELRSSLIGRIQSQPLRSAAHDFSPRETHAPITPLAQVIAGNDAAVRQLEARGFQNVTGLVRRGDNFIAQAKDQNGAKVRVVINARTGEIVGLSRILKKK
jgi:hypothetical protein